MTFFAVISSFFQECSVEGILVKGCWCLERFGEVWMMLVGLDVILIILVWVLIKKVA
jgi:hypothetical protein